MSEVMNIQLQFQKIKLAAAKRLKELGRTSDELDWLDIQELDAREGYEHNVKYVFKQFSLGDP